MVGGRTLRRDALQRGGSALPPGRRPHRPPRAGRFRGAAPRHLAGVTPDDAAPELPAAEPAPTPEPPPVDSSAAASTVTPVVLPETDVFRPHLWLRYFVTGQTNQGAQPVLVAPVDFTPPPAPATPSSRATYSTTP